MPEPPADAAPTQPSSYVPRHRPYAYDPPNQPTTYIRPRGPAPDAGTQEPTAYTPTQGPAPGAGTYEPAAYTPTQGPATGAGTYEPPTYIAPRDPPRDAVPHEPPTYIPPRQPPTGDAAQQPASDVIRYGPGVPASQAGVTAEQVWKTGRLPEAPRRPHRLRRLLGTLLTVILLAAAAVVLYLRFHHAPFHVTGVAITSQTKSGCSVDVTGRITTNGAAGTVSYQWVYQPQQAAPVPTSESVVAGTHDVYVSVSIQGQGHGSATQKVTLQVLGPDQMSSSPTNVVLSC